MLLKSLRLLVVATQLLLCLGWVAQALAGQVRLAWDATTTHTDGSPATDLAGYHLYYWQGPSGTRQSVDVGNTTTYTLTGLVDGGTYSLAVAAYDTAGNESADSKTVTVTISSVNHAPLALADTSAATAGTPLSIAVLANDTDLDGNPLTITAVTQGMHGTVTPQNTSVTYTPAATFVGTDRFTYTITDGQGASALATVTVTVLPDRAASLVAAYHFNEGSGPTVTDASGHAHTGTIRGATWTTAGKFGSALVFNGTTARVTIPDAPALRLTTAMTLEAWVKPAVVTNAWRKVFAKGKQDYFLDATSDFNKVPSGGGEVWDGEDRDTWDSGLGGEHMDALGRDIR